MASKSEDLERRGEYGAFIRHLGNAHSSIHAVLRSGYPRPERLFREAAAELRRTADRLDSEAAYFGATNGNHHPTGEC